MKRITVAAPAKVNLTLHIPARLENGYHAVETVMQTVTLFDRVTAEKAQGLHIAADMPLTENEADNTAHRAATLFADAVGVLPHFRIAIQKHIPLQAGLAGGSADAAGTLVALNKLCGTPLTADELCALGARVGADVPFCLRGGTMLATGIGTALAPLPPLPDCCFVIAKPAFGVSTAAAYAAVDGAPFLPATDAMQRALQTGDLFAVGAAMENRFAQVLRLAEVDRLCDALKKAGALGACMTGSGSAVIGLFETKAAAEAAQSAVGSLCAFSAVAAPFCGGPKTIEEL